MPLAPRAKSTGRYQAVPRKKAGGATYTPPLLADFVARKMVEASHLDRIGTIRVLDPAVGDGELLLSLLDQLQGRSKDIVTVHGFDTDQAALEEARRRLAARFPRVNLILEHGSFLDFAIKQEADRTAPSLFASERNEGFDLVIANPPYVRAQILGAGQTRKLAAAFGLSGRIDLYFAFLMGIARVLRPGGMAGLIVSNRFMTTKGGAAVRAALRSRFALRHVWDLGDTRLFDAAVLPAVILAEGPNGQHPASTAFSSIYETTGQATEAAQDPVAALEQTGIVALDDGRRFHVRHGALDATGEADSVWRIATRAGDAWLATVEAHRWGCFGDIGNIRVGVKTCADKVFIRTDWDIMPDEVRPELLRPLTTHHSAGRFRATPAAKPRAILYPHESIDGQRRAVDLTRYPKSAAYLEAHRETLEKRSYVMESGRRWYETWVPQDPAAWARPKLVFRDISERPAFWLDLEGSIVNGDCYWLSTQLEDRTDLLWLAAAIANSTFAEAFYDHRFNNKLYAGRRRFITQYVELFPLPDPATALARDIVSGAKAIYEAANGPDTAMMEERLDRMVWQAFGLQP